ncbi:MAG: polymer-forming cytoskeletal protein [Pseudomonadota bacterium]
MTESEPEQAQQIEDDMVFAADDELRLDAKSSDDVFAAGNSIDVNGATADHLIMAGGEISITDASAEDLIVAGGEIDFVNGVVADDIVAAGGEIVIGSGFTIGGSAVLAGGSARINAPIPGDLRVMSDNVVLNSAVGGNVRLTADNVEIGPNARIAGDLEYRSDKLEIQPGAVVEGETRILPVSETYAVEDLSKGAGGFFLMLGLSILVSYFVVVIALVFAAPGLMRATSRMMQEQPWKSLGLGLLIAVIVPVLGIVMVWSVVGVPVAVLLFTASIAITPIALATTAYFAGDGARRLLTSNKEAATGIGARLLWPGLGALVIFALTLIPLVGLVVWLLAMLFGLGAVANSAGKALAKSA